jgi:hypothetical protein
MTKCICSFFSNSKVRKQINFSRETTSVGKEGQPSTDSISMPEEGGGVPKEARGGGPK